MFKKFISIFVKNPDDYANAETRTAYGKFSSVLSILLNVLLFAFKLLAGILSGAISIIADALNNLTDASSNVISFLGFKLASKPADADHPYGHGRYEYISAAVVAVIIMLIGFELLGSGIEKIITPSAVKFSVLAVVILAVSIIIKILMYILNNNIGKKINSDTLIASAIDSRNDVITTACVLASVILTKFINVSLDGYVAVGVSIFILINGFTLVKNTIDPLLGKPADKTQVEYIKNKLLSYTGVLGIHDLIIHDYGPGRQFASVHIEMSASENVLQSHEIIDGIEKDFLNDDNITMVIHFDPVCIDNELVKELRVFLAENVKLIDESLSVHDVRIVEGIEHDIVIFDCVMPYNFKLTEQDLKLKLNEIIKNTYPKLDSVITIDRSFVSE